jgi:transposase
MAIDTLPDIDALHVTQLGIDEHRYRGVRWYRDVDTGAWTRVEPWMTTIVNTRSGQVLGIVDGRDSVAVEGWLGARSQTWRDRISVVAIDPSAAFRKAITGCLPNAKIAVDPFHLVQLGNLLCDPGSATPRPRPPPTTRTQDRPGLSTPDAAATRLQHFAGAWS